MSGKGQEGHTGDGRKRVQEQGTIVVLTDGRPKAIKGFQGFMLFEETPLFMSKVHIHGNSEKEL
jgi:hypothetical protein